MGVYFVCMELYCFIVSCFCSMLFCIAASMANQFIPKFSSCLQWIRQYTVLGTGYMNTKLPDTKYRDTALLLFNQGILIIYTLDIYMLCIIYACIHMYMYTYIYYIYSSTCKIQKRKHKLHGIAKGKSL